MLNKEAILSADDRKTAIVEVPEWGGSVTIKEMSGRQRNKFEQLVLDEKQRNAVPDLKAWLVAQSVINEDGSPMFSELEVLKLAEKSGKVLTDLMREIQTLNGLGGTASVEVAEGN